MKAFIKYTALFVLLFSVSNTAFAQEVKKTQKAVIKTTITCDHCKECETCGHLFEKTLIHEKGVQMVTLNVEKMTIEVIYNSKKTNLEAIKKAISNLGYDADDVKATAEGYEKLDGCCKV